MMDHSTSELHTNYRIEPSGLDALIEALWSLGYRVIGPRVGDQAIVYGELRTASDLPVGWVDEQGQGRYRIRQGKTPTFFAYNLGCDSWKAFLFPKRQLLWRAARQDGKLAIAANAAASEKLAFFGVRHCELQAIRVQNRVHDVAGVGGTGPADTAPFLVGVNCSQAAATCFCTSMGGAPGFSNDDTYDLLLTEFYSPQDHHFIVSAGTTRGLSVLRSLNATAFDPGAAQRVGEQLERTAISINRRLKLDNPTEFFAERMQHPHWEAVADRCLSCANCTMVCPTCFCTTVEDESDLTGDHAARWLRWDSCFNLDFSYIHGGSVRQSTRARYRQWLTHKLGSWHEQFGTSGCVGCGRCIAWCPVGIDLTEAVAELAKPVNGAQA